MNEANRQNNDVRRAIVTGAGGALGRAIALALARRGWTLALADVDLASAEETGRRVVAAGGQARVEPLDVACEAQWRALRQRLEADWPGVDLLVNNAGVVCAGEVGAIAPGDWRWQLDVNLFGAIHGCQTFLDWLERNPRGAHIVNVASLAAVLAGPRMGPYNVSKAGLLALSETLYVELRRRGVGVTVVCPGFFDSGLVAAGRFAADRERAMAAKLRDRATATADSVAELTLRAVARKRLYVITPLRGRVLWHVKRLAPRAWLRLMSWIYQRSIKAPRPQKS